MFYGIEERDENVASPKSNYFTWANFRPQNSRALPTSLSELTSCN